MKTAAIFKFLFLPLVVLMPVSDAPESPAKVLGVYVGTSLCAEVSKPMLNIDPTAQCDRNKWHLTLYVDSGSLAPTTYKLSTEYGYHVDNRTLLMKGSNVREGNWSIVKGAKTNPNAVVYQLDPGNPNISISFQNIDPNLIHLLERDRSLVVGSAAQSFTLSRIDSPILANKPAANLSMQSTVGAANVSGVGRSSLFSGRSPCQEVARQLNHPVGSDCFKLKWGLTLQQDANTLIPSTFKLRGTLFRDFDRTGTWSVLRGKPGDPDATIYKLELDKNQGTLFLLKADSNILLFLHNDGSLMVGNSDFSYTLNRDKR